MTSSPGASFSTYIVDHGFEAGDSPRCTASRGGGVPNGPGQGMEDDKDTTTLAVDAVIIVNGLAGRVWKISPNVFQSVCSIFRYVFSSQGSM